MSAASAASSVSLPSRPGWRRMAGLLALSVLLHWAALDWSDWHLPAFGKRVDSPADVTVRLLPPAPAHAALAPPQTVSKPILKPTLKPTPKPVSKPAPHRARRPRHASSPPPASAPVPDAVSASAPVVSSAAPAAAASVEPAAVAPVDASAGVVGADTPPQDVPMPPVAAEAPTDALANPPTDTPSPLRVEPPPPARLVYDVRALRQGQNVYGHGRIDWRVGDGRYQVDGEAGVLFFNVLEFHSDGDVGEGGISPLLYTEKRFRKPETDTHFRRDPNLISFSASTASYPRTGSEQDRASIVWQLAGMGRGDARAFVPGTEIDVFVAAVRDGDTWRIRVLGEEDIDLDGATARAWHLVREPRPGSYDQKLDMWFAPDRQWYPVRLRYTEPGGDFLDMVLSEIGSPPS
ncbi:MAG: DUF3108 domain-containing protein [Burkholderiaceae bacterium]